MKIIPVSKHFSFIAGIKDTGNLLSNIFASFCKNLKWNTVLRGLGENDLWKKPEVENLVSYSLYSSKDLHKRGN